MRWHYKTLPQNKVIDLRLMSAKKDVDVAKGQMYPSITAFGGIGTSYVNVKRPVIGPGPDKATDAYVTVGSTDLQCVRSIFYSNRRKTYSFWRPAKYKPQ